MMQRAKKFVVGVVHLALLALLGFTVTGYLGDNWGSLFSFASLSWLCLTIFLLPELLETYEDHLSRFQIFLPMAASLVLSFGLHFIEPTEWLRWFYLPMTIFFQSIFLAGWGAVLLQVRQRCQDFTWQGYGPLPKNIWLNPPAAALQEGDIVLTAGPKARTMRDSVVHVEQIIQGRKGRLMAFSSYIAQGAVLNTARAMVKVEERLGDHYIAIRLRVPFTAQQSALAMDVADRMLADNDAWRSAKTRRRVALVRCLPLPARLKNWLLNKDAVVELVKKRPPTYIESWQIWLHRRVWPTGYDFWGGYTGSIQQDHWTCMGAMLELLKRINVPVRRYGTGFLGLGTGWLNPLMPVRMMSDPCFRLVTLEDKAAYEAANPAESKKKEE